MALRDLSRLESLFQLVRAIVEGVGGKVSAGEAAGGGAVMTVELPLGKG